ncbi:TRAM domain-containing protein [Mycolicibacterium litorale]|uniref:TRAM domain-containing protein n=1 Tax=Candidatus Mycolicibacterium alkanivorans TaxID=2954114 RepID=A0ABS9YZQ5_9MYCO|nr:TRAM domain-containing protein [Candidatus Mycolicibacterium alkanivorans]MCI4676264.1 TRAM domain-containing protein [Candidatus Mycolicibacterium alkanivorans]
MTDEAPAELVVSTGAAANGGSCVARHEGRVIFVRYALPGERVRVRITGDRGSYWHAEAFEVLEPSPDRVDSLCPIAGVDGAGCCDLAFAEPHAARVLKGQVVANQLERLGEFAWQGAAEPVGDDVALGWRARVRLDVDAEGRAGFHRYHSAELVTDLQCGQLPAGMLDGLDGPQWHSGEQVYVVVDDDGQRHVVATSRAPRCTRLVEGAADTVQRVAQRVWRVPVTGFWQAHRAAASTYSALVTEWTTGSGAASAWDLYGGAGVFAAALADVVGEAGRVLTVDTSRAASRSARTALADLPQVEVVTDSVRRVLGAQRGGADVAVLDPPRSGAGREVVELLAAAGVPRVVHIGCEAAAFSRDVGLYQRAGYTVEQIRVFDSFPLTHHVECVALLTK